MTRDLSLKCIKIHGHYVRCQICKKHNAVERFLGILVCRQCLKPMAIGFMTGKIDGIIKSIAVNDREVKE